MNKFKFILTVVCCVFFSTYTTDEKNNLLTFTHFMNLAQKI